MEAALGKDGVCSNYRYDLVDSTWRFLEGFSGGNAVFTFPSTPVKCAGAPQKIMYLADDHLRRVGVRSRSKVTWASAGRGRRRLDAAADRRRQAALVEVFNKLRLRRRGAVVVIRLRERTAGKDV